MKILVCSSSPLKRGAVVDAVERIDPLLASMQTQEASSGVPAQPLGDVQTLLGALQRAGRGSATGHYVVAAENGATARGAGFVDLAYVVIVGPSGHVTVRASKSVPIPPELVTASRISAQTMTCGQLEAARTPNCDHDDPHVVWSGGTTNRRRILADAIEEALREALRVEFQTSQAEVTP